MSEPARTPETSLSQCAKPAPLQLTRKQKAAIVVRYLLKEGADVPLASLPDELQAELTQQMGRLRLVDRETLASVATEFADQLEAVGLSFSGGIAGALGTLDGRISATAQARLQKEAGLVESADPWDRIKGLSQDALLDMIKRENVEICAVILSKLDVAQAAAVLAALPGERAREITLAVSKTGGIEPDAVQRIGMSLVRQLDRVPITAFDKMPADRISAILNNSPAAKRDELLETLNQNDPDLAKHVRKSILTFAQIPKRVAPRDMGTIIRAVDQADVAIALAGAVNPADTITKEFILENLPTRLAEGIREQASDLGGGKPEDAEKAMLQIVMMIKSLEQDGTIILMPYEADAIQ